VFKDVLNYLKRSGFDTFVIKEGKDIQEAAAGLILPILIKLQQLCHKQVIKLVLK
jgi:uncharacterized protein (DUF934 family)